VFGKKIFYGWKMVFAAASLQFIQSMMLHQAFGAYVAVLIQDKGWSKTSVSGASAMMSMEAAVIGPILGWFLDRFGSRGVIKVGVIMFGIGFMLLSQIDTLLGFYGAVIVIAIGSSMAGYFPLNVGVIQWFEKKRARALSMVGLGLALGGMFVPIVAWSIESIGWRETAFGCGVLSIVIGFPLACIFRRRPEDFGETVDGLGAPRGTVDVSAAEVQTNAEPEFTAKQALRTKAFWLLSAGHGVALIIVTAVNTHAINHMRISLGYTIAQAAFYITLMTGFQVIGVLLGGVLGDKLQKNKVAAVCMTMHMAGMLMLTYALGPVMLVLFAVFHGLAWGIRGPFMQAIRADYFGRKSIGMILGLSAMLTAVGQVSGPLLAGIMGDATGNYDLGFTVLALIAGAGTFLFWFAKPPPMPGMPASTQAA
jgi:OFA family oxalate/formate antiporter-like MFS transporter